MFFSRRFDTSELFLIDIIWLLRIDIHVHEQLQYVTANGKWMKLRTVGCLIVSYYFKNFEPDWMNVCVSDCWIISRAMSVSFSLVRIWLRCEISCSKIKFKRLPVPALSPHVRSLFRLRILVWNQRKHRFSKLFRYRPKFRKELSKLSWVKRAQKVLHLRIRIYMYSNCRVGFGDS